jgi:competence protein ComEC
MAERDGPPRRRRGIAGGVAGGIAGTWPPSGAAQPVRGLAPSGFAAWTPYVVKLREWARAEAGAGRLLPWMAVAFGAGIALYFAASHEPVLSVTVISAAAASVAAVAIRRTRFLAASLMIAAIAAGFATATVRTARVAHVVLTRPLYSVSLSGFVESRDIRERTDRFVLRVRAMEAPRQPAMLERVRLSVKKGSAPAVGSFVELKARLMPPLAPLRPGSYDFSRDLFFQGISASGFVMGTIRTVQPPERGGLMLRYAAFMQGLRDAIDARIRGQLDGDERAIATALLTGRRDAITEPVNDAMFISGLGHVLSISGYHMAVVAGVVFFAVRALLALIPGLAASVPIKKWAAAAALGAATFYLLLSGAEVATQRSFFMTAVVLIAVLVDRRAVTVRTLAVAALVVLAIAPEALVHPSFQMSFAATLGLVALVQVGMPRLFATPDSSMATRIALWGGREVVVLVLASLVAGLATTPYAAFHFHRVTPYGVLANLAAMPVVSVLVMPAGLLGLGAVPFGLDGFFWWLMGLGIDWMIAVTRWVAALPGAIGRIAAFGIGPVILASAGIVLMGLLRTPLRWSGGLVLALAVAWALSVEKRDILISGDGHNLAVRGRDSRLHLMRRAKDVFLLKEWLASDADARASDDPSLGDGISCDTEGCVTEIADGRIVARALRPDALADDCERAALVVSADTPSPDCGAVVLDLARIRRQGALALWRRENGFAVEAVRPRGFDRPWSPAPVGGADNDTMILSQPTPDRARQTTPSEADVQSED